MGKSASRLKNPNHKQGQAHHAGVKKNVSRRHHSQGANQSSNGNGAAGKQKVQAGAPVLLKIPFSKGDRILLVGEGDFSFTESLVRHHGLTHLTATSFDSRETLDAKYPGVSVRLDRLSNPESATATDGRDTLGEVQEWTGFSSASERSASLDEDIFAGEPNVMSIYHGIDATKLSTTHKKVLNKHAPFTKIVFNFPHVGGLSTDVNRQVRSNQQLLVGFFNAAKPLLATRAHPVTKSSRQDTYGTSDEDSGQDKWDRCAGNILVTLFEGEPYTLWNIRDLARHCGLKVVESFKFPWAAYPGYQHARTLGEVMGKDRSDDGTRKGAWRGEERDARCYVLNLEEAEGPYPAAGQGRKRKKLDDDSD